MMPMAQGLGFSVPLDTIKTVVARIAAQERETQMSAYHWASGVCGSSLILITKKPQLLQQFGMEILEVRSSGPADRAELKRQDVIIAADEESITEPRDLQRVVRRHQTGEKIALSFLRGGKKRKVTVVL